MSGLCAPGATSEGSCAAARSFKARKAPGGRTRTRGRSPWRDTAAGWKDILWRAWGEVSEQNLFLIAGGVTYAVLLALFPGLAALVSLYGLVFDSGQIERQVAALSGVLPAETQELLSQQLHSLVQASSGALGFAAMTALLLALWSASRGMSGMITAINIAYEEKERRGFVKLNLMAGLTLGLLAGGIVAISLVAILPAVVHLLAVGPAAKWLLLLAQWPLLIVLVMLGLAVLYRFGPSRDKPQWRWVSPGAGAATLLWIAGSVGFTVYVANFNSYDKTYGSLGGVVILLTWLYLSSLTVLLGAAINAQAEKQTRRTPRRDRPGQWDGAMRGPPTRLAKAQDRESADGWQRGDGPPEFTASLGARRTASPYRRSGGGRVCIESGSLARLGGGEGGGAAARQPILRFPAGSRRRSMGAAPCEALIFSKSRSICPGSAGTGRGGGVAGAAAPRRIQPRDAHSAGGQPGHRCHLRLAGGAVLARTYGAGSPAGAPAGPRRGAQHAGDCRGCPCRDTPVGEREGPAAEAGSPPSRDKFGGPRGAPRARFGATRVTPLCGGCRKGSRLLPPRGECCRHDRLLCHFRQLEVGLLFLLERLGQKIGHLLFTERSGQRHVGIAGGNFVVLDALHAGDDDEIGDRTFSSCSSLSCRASSTNRASPRKSCGLAARSALPSPARRAQSAPESARCASKCHRAALRRSPCARLSACSATPASRHCRRPSVPPSAIRGLPISCMFSLGAGRRALARLGTGCWIVERGQTGSVPTGQSHNW